MPKTLTSGAETQITRDWQGEMPGLAIYRPRHLLRRVGPLVVGICLDRDSVGDKYKPCFHVHCLGKAFPCVSLTLCTQLRAPSGGPDYVEVQWHEQKYKEAAARMREQSLLPLEGDLTIQSVLAAYSTHIATPLGARQVAVLRRDMIILSAWAGESAMASSLLRETLLGDPRSIQQVGGAVAFETECRQIIDQPAMIEQTVHAQITALGLTGLPQSRLLTR